MAPYFWLISIPCILAVFYNRKPNALIYFLIFLLFVCFVGLRYRVGIDWSNYGYIHKWVSEKSFHEVIIRAEPLSLLLFWVSTNLGQGMLVSNIVAAAILLIGVFAFSLKTTNPWLAIAVATPYLLIAFGMSGIRQAMAVGVIMLMFSSWKNISFVKQVFFIFVAALFHTSAIIVVLFLAGNNMRLSRRVALGVVMLPIVYYVVFNLNTFSSSVVSYQESYLSKASIVSPGAMMHIVLVLGPALIFLALRKKLRTIVHNYNLLMLGSVATILLLPVFLISTTIASRLTLYLYFVPMMLYPAIAILIGGKFRAFYIYGICIMHLGVLAGWMHFANNSYAYLPYQNVLFGQKY